MTTPGFPLIDIVNPLIDEVSSTNLSNEQKEEIRNHVLAYINKEKDYETLVEEVIPFNGILQAIYKVKNIMDTENSEIPKNSETNFTSSDVCHRCGRSTGKERHKTRQWTEYEDNRLLMGVKLYGLDDWNEIAKYVGNGRLRSQCMQRWTRGLDPRISKKQWTDEEEEKLIKLVKESKDKSWTRISACFGNRSDVQCRYKYIQLCKGKKISPSGEKLEKETKVAGKKEEESFTKNLKKVEFTDNNTIKMDKTQTKQQNNIIKKNQFPIPIFSPDFDRFNELSIDSAGIGYCDDYPYEEMNFSFFDIGSTSFTNTFF